MPSSSTDYDYNDEITSSRVTIGEALQADLYKSVDVLAKVMSKEDKTTVITKQGKRLVKNTCVIAGANDSIQLSLWEDHISKVQRGKTYLFKSVRVRVFDDTKYLTTNEATLIEERDDLADINLSSDIIKDNILEAAQCIAALIKKSSSCIVCNTSIDLDEEKEDTITCPSCQMTMLASLLNDKFVGTLVIKTPEGKKETYTCFNDTLQSFLLSINRPEAVDEIPIEELQDLLVRSGLKNMVVDNANKRIDQFLL